MSVFAKRLKEARKQAGLSQERLGVLAGVDEMSSSARMNQYERGKHEPDFSMVERLADVLNVPESYFYAKDDEAAWLQVVFHRIPTSARKELLEFAQSVNQWPHRLGPTSDQMNKDWPTLAIRHYDNCQSEQFIRRKYGR